MAAAINCENYGGNSLQERFDGEALEAGIQEAAGGDSVAVVSVYICNALTCLYLFKL